MCRYLSDPEMPAIVASIPAIPAAEPPTQSTPPGIGHRMGGHVAPGLDLTAGHVAPIDGHVAPIDNSRILLGGRMPEAPAAMGAMVNLAPETRACADGPANGAAAEPAAPTDADTPTPAAEAAEEEESGPSEPLSWAARARAAATKPAPKTVVPPKPEASAAPASAQGAPRTSSTEEAASPEVAGADGGEKGRWADAEEVPRGEGASNGGRAGGKGEGPRGDRSEGRPTMGVFVRQLPDALRDSKKLEAFFRKFGEVRSRR